MNLNRIQIDGHVFGAEDIQKKLNDRTLSDWEKGIYKFILNWFDDSDFILQKTSGSTGMPKEIELKKNAMIASAKRTIQFFGLKENDSAWLCLPINYIAGKMMVVRAIVRQLNLILTEPKGNPQFPDQNIEFTAMVPMQVQKLIEEKANFSSIKKLIIGGAATDSSLLEKLQNISTEVYATYGMTETCSHIALQRLNGTQPDSHFRILPNISIHQNDKNCLVIDAPDLSENSIETLDMVELISDHKFKILGRADNIINSGGLKISPEELENRIEKIIHKECIIIPERDALLGQKLVLVIEGNYSQKLAAVLLEKIKFGIGRHKSPKHLRFIHQFPRTPSMKIDRNKVILYMNSNE